MAVKRKKPATKKAVKKKVPNREQTDDLQSLHDAAVSNEVLGKPKYILGRELRPVTLETIVLLKQINSPLVLGVSMEEIENIFLDCCVFIVLQSGDNKEARRLAWNPDELRDAALDLAAEVPATEFETVSDSVNNLLVEATQTSVEAKAKKGGADDDPLGN